MNTGTQSLTTYYGNETTPDTSYHDCTWTTDTYYDEPQKCEDEEYIDKDELKLEREHWREIQKRHHFHQTKWGHNKPRGRRR